jgi:hypothetical protein
VLFLNLIVIGLQDGFFAGVIVIRGPERDICLPGDLTHRGVLEAVAAKQEQSGREYGFAGGLGAWVGFTCLEHVQIIGTEPAKVKTKMNMFNN